jgi:hypothetical protein
LFCESVVTGEDKTLTLVRTVDTITLPPEIAAKMEGYVDFGGAAKLVVLLKQANAVGHHEIIVAVRNPSKTVDPMGLIQQDFPANAEPEVGYNFVTPVRLKWRGKGLYWIEVRVGKQLLARTPLRINIGKPTEKPKQG